MSSGFSRSQLKAIAVVGWGNGISEKGLADYLKKELSNCSTEIVKPLVTKGIFYNGKKIITGRRGRPRSLLCLKNNPYLLGYIRDELQSRCRAYDNKKDKINRSYDLYRTKNANIRKMGFLEEAEFHRNSRFFRAWVKLNQEHSECEGILNAFTQGSTFKKTKGIPMPSFEPDVLCPPPDKDDPEYDEFLRIMLGSWGEKQQEIRDAWERSDRQWEEQVLANRKTLMILWESWEKQYRQPP